MKRLVPVLSALCAALALAALPAAARAAPRVLFVLDASGSMWGQIEGRPKIEIARAVLGDLVGQLPEGTEVGLEAYGHHRKDDCSDIELVAPVGSDPQAVLQAVAGLDPKGKTPLTEAIRLAAAELRQTEGSASVVVVSDGKETCEGDPCAAAREARAAGVDLRIHVVGFDVGADEASQLRCIADAGGGQYYGARNAGELVTAFQQVKKQVAMQQDTPPAAPAEPASAAVFEDHFERDQLGPGYETLHPDPNRLALVDGKAMLVTAMKPDGQPVAPNTVLLDRTLDGDFVATLRMDTRMVQDHWAGMLYWVDEKNYLFLGPHGRCCGHTRAPRFGKMLGGDWSAANAPFGNLGARSLSGYAEDAETWYLRIERDGVKYTGSVSIDGQDWKEVGTHAFLDPKGRLGFTSYLTYDRGMGESPVEIDDLVIESSP